MNSGFLQDWGPNHSQLGRNGLLLILVPTHQCRVQPISPIVKTQCCCFLSAQYPLTVLQEMLPSFKFMAHMQQGPHVSGIFCYKLGGPEHFNRCISLAWASKTPSLYPLHTIAIRRSEEALLGEDTAPSQSCCQAKYPKWLFISSW